MRRVYNLRWEDYKYIHAVDAWMGHWYATVVVGKTTHTSIPCVFTANEDTPEIRQSVKIQGYELLQFRIEEIINGRGTV